MTWVRDDHLILCCHCQKQIYRSEARRDRNKLLACIECRDLRLSIDTPNRQLRKDPYPVNKINIEPADVFSQRPTWDTITEHWGSITTTWDEL